ncbi:hypothetical protein Bbelb_376100 [Branchiostoma belcheri]|nr:hypothetical protein Bbelb_376100 [Branchiostoma belcheri]
MALRNLHLFFPEDDACSSSPSPAFSPSSDWFSSPRLRPAAGPPRFSTSLPRFCNIAACVRVNIASDSAQYRFGNIAACVRGNIASDSAQYRFGNIAACVRVNIASDSAQYRFGNIAACVRVNIASDSAQYRFGNIAACVRVNIASDSAQYRFDNIAAYVRTGVSALSARLALEPDGRKAAARPPGAVTMVTCSGRLRLVTSFPPNLGKSHVAGRLARLKSVASTRLREAAGESRNWSNRDNMQRELVR